MKKTDTCQPSKGLTWLYRVLTQRYGVGPTSRGFTLSELLVSLAVLGIIASLAIPKVLNNVQKATYKSIFKQRISELSEIQNKGVLEGRSAQGDYPNSYIYWAMPQLAASLQYQKACPNSALAGGCYGGTDQGVDYSNDNGLLFQDGSSIIYGNTGGVCMTSGSEPKNQSYVTFVLIDANGRWPPNVTGTDQLKVAMYYGPGALCNGGPETGPGRMTAPYTDPGTWVANKALFVSLFD